MLQTLLDIIGLSLVLIIFFGVGTLWQFVKCIIEELKERRSK